MNAAEPGHRRVEAGPVAIGVALLALYAVVCVATLATTAHPVRPLFEGYTPPQPYRWVHPPPDLASANVKPKPSVSDIGFEAAGSGAGGISTEDAQLAVTLGVGAIPRHGDDTKVTATITPLDPATLGPVPGGLVPDGNAYRVEMVYRPSGAPVGSVSAGSTPGIANANVVVTAPLVVQALLFSPDGRSWRQVDTQNMGDPAVVGATFSQPGYYLAAAPPGAASTPSASGSGTSGSVVAVAAAVAAAALVLGMGPVLWRRRRR